MGAYKNQLINQMEHPEQSPRYQKALSNLLRAFDLLLCEQSEGQFTEQTLFDAVQARTEFYEATGE